MLRTALNPHHWFTSRWITSWGAEHRDGHRGLPTALALACSTAIDDNGARRVTIFDGKQSDGAKVVARIDLDGLDSPLDALRKAEAFMAGFEDDCGQEGLPGALADVRAAIAALEA